MLDTLSRNTEPVSFFSSTSGIRELQWLCDTSVTATPSCARLSENLNNHDEWWFFNHTIMPSLPRQSGYNFYKFLIFSLQSLGFWKYLDNFTVSIKGLVSVAGRYEVAPRSTWMWNALPKRVTCGRQNSAVCTDIAS